MTPQADRFSSQRTEEFTFSSSLCPPLSGFRSYYSPERRSPVQIVPGLLGATFAKTQIQASHVATFFYLPSVLLSGFMFPFQGMPQPAQNLAELLPLTHFIRLISGIVVRGASLVELLPQLYALGIFTVVALSIAIARFRKCLD